MCVSDPFAVHRSQINTKRIKARENILYRFNGFTFSKIVYIFHSFVVGFHQISWPIVSSMAASVRNTRTYETSLSMCMFLEERSLCFAAMHSIRCMSEWNNFYRVKISIVRSFVGFRSIKLINSRLDFCFSI